MNISRKSGAGIEERFRTWFRRLLIPPVLAVFPLLAACGTGEDESGMSEEQEPPSETIEQVLRRVTDEWMAIPGVAGTGLGLCDGAPCIKVFVTRPVAEIDPPIPDDVDGHPVRVEQSGPFRARDSIPAPD